MAQEAVFLVNLNGGVHNVPGEWVTQDRFGHPLVRGNGGYEYANDEQIENWYAEQGLDEDDRKAADDSSGDDEVRPQISNMKVADPPQGNITAKK